MSCRKNCGALLVKDSSSKIRPVGLGFVDKAEICKRRAITAFNAEWKISRDRTRSYECASEVLERAIKTLSIVNKGAITGLRGELLYYSLEFKTQHLAPESAAGFHSDFRGIIHHQPSAIDVTTMPAYKDADEFVEVKNAFGKKWGFYIGVVDLKSPGSALYPLLLPRCEDGNMGHFVLIIDVDDPKLIDEYTLDDTCIDSTRQMLVTFNPYADDAENAIESVKKTWRHRMTSPSWFWEALLEEYVAGASPAGYTRDASYNWKKPELVEEYSRLEYEFRHDTGYMISAIVSRDTRKEFGAPFGMVTIGEYDTRLWWVHPHAFVRRMIGKPLDKMKLDIARVAHDK